MIMLVVEIILEFCSGVNSLSCLNISSCYKLLSKFSFPRSLLNRSRPDTFLLDQEIKEIQFLIFSANH